MHFGNRRYLLKCNSSQSRNMYMVIVWCIVHCYIEIFVAFFVTTSSFPHLYYIHLFTYFSVISYNRCFVNLNPNRGNKRAKIKGKHHTVNPKVLSLANALKDFQSQWVL
jgi:hypothetical protein